jgi:cupin 2 domain-containing protein
MAPNANNLFDGIPAILREELFQTLAESGGIRVERIVSDGQATPPGEWYDQGWDEWVLLVSGGATLLFDDGVPSLILKPGDHVMIPANCRHRVERTDTGQKTIWLAIHFGGSDVEQLRH